jgi:anthranilate synthase component 2
MQKILLIDNYDSFTYNLLHYLEYSGNCNVDVFRNDCIQLESVNSYDSIVISPGPGLPNNAGIVMKLLEQYYNKKKILGVCLGHQSIAEFFGAELYNLEKVFHGIATEINLNSKEILFNNIPDKIKVGRYHSWAVSSKNLPQELEITSTDNSNIIMSLSHNKYAIKSVQFHPESILTEHGLQIINNWKAL